MFHHHAGKCKDHYQIAPGSLEIVFAERFDTILFFRAVFLGRIVRERIFWVF